jgi:drug/metabolite transporter (DMT)-like permease
LNLFEKLVAFDRRVVSEAFQPLQDALSNWRAQSDHLIAVLCFFAYACLGATRMNLDGASAPSGARALGCLLALATALTLHLYGRINRNSGSPGLFAAGFPISVAIRMSGAFMLALSLVSLFISPDTRTVTLNGLGDLLWLVGACFAGCTLQRPSPRRVKALARALA